MSAARDFQTGLPSSAPSKVDFELAGTSKTRGKGRAQDGLDSFAFPLPFHSPTSDAMGSTTFHSVGSSLPPLAPQEESVSKGYLPSA